MTWSVQSYSTTPGSNSNVNGINIAEGCNASNMNDAMRQMMADIANMVSGGSITPPGVIQEYAGATAPTGFLLCDGSAVSRTGFASLFTAIATTYGAGDGSTTFNLPDLRGRTTIGAGAGAGLTNRALAASGGEETHLLTSAETPAVAFTGTGTTSSISAGTPTLNETPHTHTLAVKTSDSSGAFSADGSGTTSGSATTDPASTGITANALPVHAHTVSVSGNTSGGGGAHNNMQPFLAVNFIIKT